MSKDMSVTMAVQDRKFKKILTDKKPSVDIFKKYSMMPQGLYTSWGTPWYNFEVIVTRGKLGLSQPVRKHVSAQVHHRVISAAEGVVRRRTLGGTGEIVFSWYVLNKKHSGDLPNQWTGPGTLI